MYQFECKLSEKLAGITMPLWVMVVFGLQGIFLSSWVRTDMVIKMGSNRNENEGENIWSFKRHRAHIQQERRGLKIMQVFLTPENLNSDASKGKNWIIPNLELWNFKNSGGFFKLVITMILSKMVFLFGWVFLDSLYYWFHFVYADNLTVLI